MLRLFGMKTWRRPTLAEPIEPLPSAMLCLTAEFGMGSGRATALWSPKNLKKWSVVRGQWSVATELTELPLKL